MVYILLSTFNGENYLNEQIESLRRQINIEFKILVRDDGSTDSTPQILDGWSKKGVLTWYKGENMGYARSFLNLLRTAPDADYYAFCDQDDIWLPDKLECALNKLDKMPTPVKLYCSNLYVYRNGANEGLWWNFEPEINLYRALVQNIVTGCTAVFSKSLRDIVKNNLPGSIALHDFWLYHTALLFGSVYFDSQAHIYYRQHGKNQIGAKNRTIDRVRSKVRSISTLSKQHYREHEAKQLLECYGNLISEDKKNIVYTIAHYKDSIRRRFILLFSMKYRMYNWLDTFWFKIRIIVGCI